MQSSGTFRDPSCREFSRPPLHGMRPCSKPAQASPRVSQGFAVGVFDSSTPLVPVKGAFLDSAMPIFFQDRDAQMQRKAWWLPVRATVRPHKEEGFADFPVVASAN